MLTCKVGNQLINCFDGTYDKFQLKKWSDKNILICPDCGKPYEYCHGLIVPPYFRHKEKDKDCDGVYSEPETKEHLEGKKLLYNWLLQFQNQGIIKNLRLEGYISETKQRPDIYFETLDNKRHVVEFQCTPIASEYFERHELYQLANINDIWILGTEKYNFQIGDNYIVHNQFYKTIEKQSYFHLNINYSNIYVKDEFLIQYLKYKKLAIVKYSIYTLDQFEITEDGFELKEEIIEDLVKQDNQKYLDNIRKYQEEERQRKIKEEMISNQKEIVNKLNSMYLQDNNEILFSYRYGNPTYYQWGIEFKSIDKDITFFVKDNSIDCCLIYYQRLGRKGYSNIDTFKSDNINDIDVINFVLKHTSSILEEYQNEFIENEKRKEKYNTIFGEFLDEKIRLINSSKEKIDKNVRFKFLKGFNVSDEYMEQTFIKELNFLKHKNVETYIFMIPKYHSYFNSLGFARYVRVGEFNNKILEHFKKYGFTDVEYLNY